MEIKLDKDSYFVEKDGTFNQRKALINAGVKAAVCYKDGPITPTLIREIESEETLIKRGINTILNDHTTPTEQQEVKLEITNIPKILCMILNNQHQYSADERSLRYTKVKVGPYISEKENLFYQKWSAIFEKLITDNYFPFYRQFNMDDEKTKKAIQKLAGENARYGVSVFVPTTLTYTVPWAQINKICLYMNRMIDHPANEFEITLGPHLIDFVEQLTDLKVVITKKDAKEIWKEAPFEASDEPLYKNNKQIDLSLFANRNKFSGIDEKNEFGYNYMYNFQGSWASLAQFQRHRTSNFEMKVPHQYTPYVPVILKTDPALMQMWINDMEKLEDLYPQGQLVKISMKGTIEDLINYVGKERACEHVQHETYDIFINQLIPDYYDNLELNGNNKLEETLKPYVKKLRCGYPDYRCPNRCGHPRIERNI